MEKLNEYLSTLLSSCSDELRLEPEKNPYLVSANTTRDIGGSPMLGTQISMMVFPLIPPDVKAALPHNNEVEFVHPHNLGKFSFTVQKSPSGFIVSVRPILGEAGTMPQPTPAAVAPLPDSPPPFATELGTPINTPIETISPTDLPEYAFESSSSAAEFTSSLPAAPSLEDLLEAEPSMAAEYVPSIESTIEVVSANDPSFQTVFSDSSTYEPPGRRDDFVGGDVMPSFEPQYEPTPIETVASYEPQHIEQNSFMQPLEPVPAYTPPMNTPVSYTEQTPQAAWPPPVPTEEPSFAPATANPAMRQQMDQLFHRMAEMGASDLHLSVSMPPMVRKDGKMKPLGEGEAPLTPDYMRDLLTSIMPAKNQEEFARRNDTDFAYEIKELARFRCNIFMDRKGMGAVFRIIPSKILTAEQLGLSKAIMDLCALSKGLVVVTGPTGSGKSTTLCAMVDSINKNREDHIITIEDPIEFTHENQKCLVNQREVHNHTDSFKDALRAALREDPDILLVGEMRDLETISIAIETAETGHLVFGTLHTTTAPSTIDRIIDQFPADRQEQIRVMLSESLKGVIAQTLLPKKGGGRVAALEVLIITPAISNLIREGKTFQIASAMQTGKNHGMVMLNDALFEHVKNGLVEPMDAYVKAVDKTGFQTLLERGGFKL
jgi:twitching motility protein PilT